MTFNGLNVPTKVSRYDFYRAQEQFWPDALPLNTKDSHEYQRELNHDSLGTSLPPYPLSHS